MMPHLKKLEIALRMISGASVSTLGFIVLFGWYTNNHALIQVSSTWAPMQYNTAFCMLLSGFSILCLKRREKILIFLSALLFLFSTLTLSQYIFHINLGIDQLFINSNVYTYTSHPGRMAPNTAICFLLVSIMLFTSQFDRYHWNNLIAFICCTVVGVLGLTALTGYFFDVSELYGWGNFTAMAVHTAMGFFAIALGCFFLIAHQFLRDDKQKKYFPAIVVCAIGLPLFLISWQALTMHQSQMIKKSLQQESVYGELLLTELLPMHLDRVVKLLDQNIDDHDSQGYFSKIPELLSISTESASSKKWIYVRDAQAQSTIKKNIAFCEALLAQKNKNVYTGEKNVLLAVSDQLICLKKEPENFLAILDTHQLFSSIFNFPNWKLYGVELKNQDHLIFSKPIVHSTDFFKQQWGVTKQFFVMGQRWDLVLWPNEKSVRLQTSLFPNFFLLFGLIGTVLFAFVAELWKLSVYKNRTLKQYEMIFNQMAEGLCIVEMLYDADQNPVNWRYIQVNPVFKNHTGLSNVIGKTALEAIPEIEKYWIEKFGEVDLSGKPAHLENFSTALNRWYEVYAFILKDRKKIRLLFYLTMFQIERIIKKIWNLRREIFG